MRLRFCFKTKSKTPKCRLEGFEATSLGKYRYAKLTKPNKAETADHGCLMHARLT